MKLQNKLSFLVSFASIALPAFCFAADPQSLLERDLSTTVLTLGQEMNVYDAVYSGAISTDNSAVTPEDPRVLQYVETQKTSGTGTYGSGLYVSTNPINALVKLTPTAATPWILIQTVVPSGIKFLDSPSYGGLKSDTLAALNQAGCPAYGISSMTNTAGCTAFMKKALSDLQVSMIRLAGGTNASVSYCKSNVNLSFVLLDDSAINPTRVVAFSSDLPASPDVHSENRLMINDLSKHASLPTPSPFYSYIPAVGTTPANYVMVTPTPTPVQVFWPGLNGQPSTNMPAWSQSELYDCGKDALELLQDELKPQIRTVSRDVTLFSWAPKSSVTQKTTLDGQDQDFFNYANYLVSTYYQTPAPTGDMVGPGLYAAIDPVATQSYGGADPVLMQIILPQGTNFLDLNGAQNLSYTLTYTNSGGSVCSISSIMQLFTSINTPACRELRDQFTNQHSFSAIRYGYTATSYSKCPGRALTAFVIKDYNLINNHRMVGFTKDLPSSPDTHSENRLIIENLFRLAPPVTQYTYPAPVPAPSPAPSGTMTYPAPIITTSPQPGLWPSLDSQTPQTDVPNWMTSNIMGCGSYAEDL